MKKLLILFSTIFLLISCNNENLENIDMDNIYGFDVYDVMEVGDIATIKVTITKKVPHTEGGWGYEVDAEDDFGVRSSIKGEEIMGSSSQQVFYSIPTSVGNQLNIDETYYIKVQKQLYPPNRRPQLGLVGSENISSTDYQESKKRADSFNYDGGFCKINETSKCSKMVNAKYDLKDSKITLEELINTEIDEYKVYNIFVEIEKIEEFLIDMKQKKQLTIKENETLAVIKPIKINHNHHTRIIEDAELNKHYRLKIFTLGELEVIDNITYIDCFLMQVEERLS